VNDVTTPVLAGACNRCGLCCTATRDGKEYACTNLRKFTWSPLGRPEAAFCAVYERRVDGMPITLRHAPGDEFAARCAKDSVEETAVIIARGIGRGCSLTVVA
jgi:hypothetical protein